MQLERLAPGSGGSPDPHTAVLPILGSAAVAGVAFPAAKDAAGERTAEDFATALSALAAALRKVTEEGDAAPSAGEPTPAGAGDEPPTDAENLVDTATLGAAVAVEVVDVGAADRAASAAVPPATTDDGFTAPDAGVVISSTAAAKAEAPAPFGAVPPTAPAAPAAVSGSVTRIPSPAATHPSAGVATAVAPTGEGSEAVPEITATSRPPQAASGGASAFAETLARPSTGTAFGTAAESGTTAQPGTPAGTVPEVAKGLTLVAPAADGGRPVRPTVSLPPSDTATPPPSTGPEAAPGRTVGSDQATTAATGTARPPVDAAGGLPADGDPALPDEAPERSATRSALPATGDGRPRPAASGGTAAAPTPPDAGTTTERAVPRPDALLAGSAATDARLHTQTRGEPRASATPADALRAFADGAALARHSDDAETAPEGARATDTGAASRLAGGAARVSADAGVVVVTQLSARERGARDGAPAGRPAASAPVGGSASAPTGSALGSIGPQASTSAAALAGGPARIDLPPGFAALAERIVDALHLSVGRGGSDIRLRVEPEGLGHIDVRVQLRDDGVRAMIVTEHEATRALLSSQQHLLESALARSDLRLSGFSVDVSLDQGSASFHEPEDGTDDRAPFAPVPAAVPEPQYDHASQASLAPGRLSLRV